MNSKVRLLSVVFSLLVLGGCATSRSTLDIATPVSGPSAQTNGKDVYINAVKDLRVFEAKPSSPNTPSLDDSEDQSDKIKARAVGRKRNGFGKALGDILLPEGKTVESLTVASIHKAFIDRGYRVVSDKSQITSSTYVIDADITKFWSWMNPGFWALTLSAEIATAITIKSPTGTERQTVSVKAADSFQTGAEDNWIEVINKALILYVDDLNRKLQ